MLCQERTILDYFRMIVFVLLGSEFPAVFLLVDLFSYTSLETFQVNKYAIFQMILEHVMSREDHFGLFWSEFPAVFLLVDLFSYALNMSFIIL